MRTKQVTIKSIAKILNISVSTVSRALHDAFDVNPITRKKVLELAEQLEYSPNPYAVCLVNHKTNIIGVLLPEIATHFFSAVVKGIQDVAYDAGYNVMFFISDESLEREKAIIKKLSVNSLDGILVSVSCQTNDSSHFQKLKEKGLPIVFFDRVLEDMNVSKVVQNDFQGAFNATSHLIQQGYKRIAHLAGPPNLMLSKLRLQGYQAALEQNGFSLKPQYILHSGFSQAEGFQDTTELLGRKPLPDAFFVVSDRKAIGAILALRQYGFKIPQHIGVVGFTNAPISEVITPPMTTIEQPTYEIGAKSCQLLLDQIKNPNMEPQQIVMNGRLIIRESSMKSST